MENRSAIAGFLELRNPTLAELALFIEDLLLAQIESPHEGAQAQ